MFTIVNAFFTSMIKRRQLPSRGSNRLILPLLTVMSGWTIPNLKATEFVRETFSGMFAGQTVSSPKWNIAGGSFIVRDSPPHQAFGSSSLFGRIEGVNARIIATTNIPTSGLTVISFTFREPSTTQPGEAFLFGLGKSNELNSTHAALAFRLDDGVFSAGGNTSGSSSTYPVDAVRNVMVVFNRSGAVTSYDFHGTHSLANLEADVWLSSTLPSATPVKIGTFTSNANADLANQFVFRIYSAVPGNSIDIDNISVRDTIELPPPLRSPLYPVNWQPPQAPAADFDTGTFLQDFSQAGYRAGEEEPPVVSSPVWVVTNPPFNADPTGNSDSTTAIQGAIDAAEAAGGGVVKLPAGTYRVRPQGNVNYALRIDSPHVILRGDGPNQTFIFNDLNEMRSKQVILVNGQPQASLTATSATSSPITADLPGPTNQIPVANASLFAPGNWVTVRADATDAWITEHGVNNWLGYGSNLGGFAYRRRVVAVDAVNNMVIIDIPTRYTIKTRDNARLMLAANSGLEGVGLEDFSIGMLERTGTGWGEEDYSNESNTSWHTHSSYAISFFRARDCWMRNVNSYRPTANTNGTHVLSNGVHLNDSCRITLMDCHFQNAQYGGGGGNGYLYRISNSQDCLLIRCRSTYCRHAFVFSSMRSCGNVIFRCVDSITGRQLASNGASQSTSGSGSDHHMHFSHSNLIDTCVSDSSYFIAAYRPYGTAPLHEVTASHTVFWNIEGIGSSGGAVVRTEQSRMGYAIGTRGTRNTISRPTGGGNRMLPADWVEAQGEGDRLDPFSLYEDQLQKRLGPLHLDPVNQWRYTQFGANFQSPDIADHFADPDGDGQPNLMEFALNSSATSALQPVRTQMVSLDVNGTIHQAFVVPLREGTTFPDTGEMISGMIDGIRYTIERSFDLKNWTANGIVELNSTLPSHLDPVDPGWSYRAFTTTEPTSTYQRIFYRVRIEAAPE